MVSTKQVLAETSITTTDIPPEKSITASGCFNLADLRLNDVAAGGKQPAAEKVDRPWEVRQPRKNEFNRTREDKMATFGIIEDPLTRETYLTTPAIREQFIDDVADAVVALAVNTQGEAFIWPARLPRFDGDGYGHSRMEGLKISMTKFVRLRSDQVAGAYDVIVAKGELPEPKWPELPFEKILEAAFGRRVIRSADHPVLQRLQGLIA